MIKNRIYKGTFNWKGEVHTLYTTAVNKDVAFTFLVKKLSKKLGVIRVSVYNYFIHGVDRYEIEEETKDGREK